MRNLARNVQIIALGLLLGYLITESPIESRFTQTLTSAQASSIATLPIPTPTPPASSPDTEAESLLKAAPVDYFPQYTTNLEGIAPLEIKILDYIYWHPDTSYRQALLERLVADPELPLWETLSWLREDWLDETVRQAFDKASGIPAGFEEKWEKWGEFFSTDLDGNDDPDYLLTLKLSHHCPEAGRMYWLHRVDGTHQMNSLPVNVYDFDEEFVYPTIRAIEDLTGDEQPEVAYTVYTCGASTQELRLRVLSWQNNRLKDLLIGEWKTSNGEWIIHDEDKDGVAELIGNDYGSGILGFGPFLPYALLFKLHQGEYIPVEQLPLIDTNTWSRSEEADVLYWEWAKYLLHKGRFTEAANTFTTLAQGKIEFPWVDFRPYALFYSGVSQILSNNISAAQDSWEQLTTGFPDHPVSLDTVQLRQILKSKDDMWRACSWLQQNGRKWADPRWAATDKAVAFTKWQVETQQQTDYDKWLGSQGSIDYAKERETLESIFIPDYYLNHLHWGNLCHPVFLLSLQEWTQQETLEAQMTELGATWQTLSTEYDLNKDGTPDPLGFVKNGEQRYVWTFISQGAIYEPLFISQPYPPEAIDIWNNSYYVYDRAIGADEELSVTDFDKNGLPEVLSIAPYGFTLWEWIGHHFQLHSDQYHDDQRGGSLSGETSLITLPDGTTQVKALLNDSDTPNQFIEERIYQLKDGELGLISQTPSPSPTGNQLLAEALQNLFKEKNPQATLEVLKNYKPDNLNVNPSSAWYEAAALYLKALALQYAGQTNEARSIYTTLTQNFADTGWSILAEEKLK